MTRLAVAKTLVSGTVTLQGIPYSFNASASGTATGNNVPLAKETAVVASNTAAEAAARVAIDKILADNSAVLSDLEITSLISNNFTTTVKVFIPIELDTIATTTDGVNYVISKDTTIGSTQWLTVPNGKTLSTTEGALLINRGYLQFGNASLNTSDYAMLKSKSSSCSSMGGKNYEGIRVYSGECLTTTGDYTNNGVVGVESGGSFNIYGTFTNDEGGGYGEQGSILNVGTTTISGTLINSYSNTFCQNVCGATLVNNGTIENNGGSSYSSLSSGTGSCTATGSGSACNVACTSS